jgi:hypothetical protein
MKGLVLFVVALAVLALAAPEAMAQRRGNSCNVQQSAQVSSAQVLQQASLLQAQLQAVPVAVVSQPASTATATVTRNAIAVTPPLQIYAPVQKLAPVQAPAPLALAPLQTQTVALVPVAVPIARKGPLHNLIHGPRRTVTRGTVVTDRRGRTTSTVFSRG